MIQNIEISKLYEHPDNPRKIFDDEKTKELADSIRENGIMQNLTVVPYEDGYRVIIGHRRLAAARKAGLTHLPCLISDMDYNTQIATMIAENMQRVDLTVHEQVHGIQMMLNLGESTENIQKKTGLSKTTIYHRMKMTELDPKGFSESVLRGGTIEDYIKLEKIEDIKTRNLVLASIGTNNFNNEYRKAINAQDAKNRKKKWQEWLDSFAAEIKEKTPQYELVRFISPGYTEPPATVPEDAGKTEYFYFKGPYDWQLLKKREERRKTAEEIEREEREAKREMRHKLLHETDKRFRNLREDFCRKYIGKKSDVGKILTLYLKNSIGVYKQIDEDEMSEFFGFEKGADSFTGNSEFERLCDTYPQRVLLAMCCHDYQNEYRSRPFDYDNNFKKIEKVCDFYNLLEEIGYSISDEERQFYFDGTYKEFKRSEE